MDWMDIQAAGAGKVGGAKIGEGTVGGSAAAELLEGLNEPQKQAVQHSEGGLLILAGAGSGKTRVITRRVAWLLKVAGARPHEILAITFTNKAAKEMRDRIEKLVEMRGVWVSTFHAMCARILRTDIETLGAWTRDFSIYDTSDRNMLLKRLISDEGYDLTRFRPAMVGGWISERKNSVFDPEAMDDGISGMEAEVLNKVYHAYERTMRSNNALDFDDLLLKTLDLFREHPGVRDNYAHRFRYVMVDEYQDTNRVQYLLTHALSGKHRNLAVCGDPDQSIYAWRGADVSNILDFEKDFTAPTVVKLEQNYRSSKNILGAAQGVISKNLGRKEKDLWTEREGGEKVFVMACADENDEGDEIARQIKSLMASGRTADEMALFYRVNFMQRALERALRMAGVPYQIIGSVEFYARREIKDLVSYLRLLVNPADDVACARVINVPARGVGAKSMEKLTAWARDRSLSLLQAASSEEARDAIRGRAKTGLTAFSEFFANLTHLGELSASEALEEVTRALDYYAYLGKLPDADQVMREENVDELRTHAETYDKQNPEGKLRGFLQDIALVSEIDSYDENTEKVSLMTMHAAKGLEFPFVFIAGLEEELLPHARSMEDPEGIEEERRLMYVGMTRAEERLFMTRAEWRFHFGESLPRTPSRFLDEIPPEFLEGGGTEADEDEMLGVFEAPQDDAALKVGAWVEHDHFGRGLVESLRGSGINARAAVSFSGVGRKDLLLQYAKLRVIETR
ncbi:MAG: DNA helicase-2/ATP-dependent DNA helicase PcrA [Planctomycetota bacterium]|jgi:DNA helicase-2/ATP-dependent DNA helicase PcrA